MHSITFKGNNGPSQETLDYIKKAREDFHKQHNKELTELGSFDLDKMKDICKGISIFENWSAKDLAIATKNIEGILLQRGCSHQCTHCGDCSHNKITTMNWDNVQDFLNGIGQLKERLGFNPFVTKISGNDCFIPFEDSDPMLFSSIDSKGKKHNIFDFAQEFYKKTSTKLYLTTAGWEKGNENAQKAAEQLAKHPELIKYFFISLHPFHSYMARSRKFEEQGNTERASYWRNKYVDMIANAIITTFPLKGKVANYGPNYLRGPDNDLPNCSREDLDQLKMEIFAKIKELNPHFDTDKIDNFAMPIGYIGRAANLKNEDKSSRYYPINMNPDEKLKTIKNQAIYDDLLPVDIYNSTKIINTDGTILCKKHRPGAINTDFAKLPIKLNFKHPTNWKSDYSYAYIDKSKMPTKLDIN